MTTGAQMVRIAALKIMANADKDALNYAVNYAIHLAEMVVEDAPAKDIRLQCLYVLGNIAYWRGDEAKDVRSVLKAYCAENNPRK